MTESLSSTQLTGGTFTHCMKCLPVPAHEAIPSYLFANLIEAPMTGGEETP